MQLTRFAFAALLSSFFAASISASPADLREADLALRAGEADLAAARSSAGSAANPAAGSRLKLTLTRLESARARIDQAGTALKRIAPDDPSAVALRKRHETATAGLAAIDAIVAPASPANPPAANPPAGNPANPVAPANPPVASPARLDYKQQQLIKDANFHLRDAEGYSAGAAEVVARLSGDGPKPIHQDVTNALNAVATGEKKQQLAAGYLAQLPADHPDVQALAAAVTQMAEALSASKTKLVEADAHLQKLTGMENYPKYDADFVLLQDLARRYTDFANVSQRAEALAEIIREDAQALRESQRIGQTYAPLVDQHTEPGQRMTRMQEYFTEHRTAFSKELAEYRKELPAAFDKDLQEADRLAEDAVANAKPAFFGETGGISQQFGFAQSKLLVLKAFGEADAKPFADKLAASQQRMKERAKALEAQIIATNELPPDRYTAEDRADLIRRATEAFAAQQGGAQVLAVRIPSEAWTRDTRWRWSGDSFSKFDSSHLQIQLLVKQDEKLAVIRPINLYKNHLQGDTISASPLDGAKDELPPQRYLPIEKIK